MAGKDGNPAPGKNIRPALGRTGAEQGSALMVYFFVKGSPCWATTIVRPADYISIFVGSRPGGGKRGVCSMERVCALFKANQSIHPAGEGLNGFGTLEECPPLASRFTKKGGAIVLVEKKQATSKRFCSRSKKVQRNLPLP